ncbi:AraC family transcriptional regulator [Treponema sp.]
METYAARINRVIDYIEKNLGTTLDLERLASLACFSKYHFHRLFASFTGETLASYIQRLRLEKAATLLCNGSDRTITEIALDCGFSSSAAFARSFKDRFGYSATDWRSEKSNPGKTDGNIEQLLSKEWESPIKPNIYTSYTASGPIWRLEMETKKATVELKTLPTMKLAYVRHVGPYAGDSKLFENLFGKLFAWAGARDLVKPGSMTLVIYHDSPELVAEEKLRISVCLSVDDKTQGSGDIGIMALEGAKYGVGRFTLAHDEYAQAWNWMFGSWLPESGFVPDDKPCFEAYPEPPLSDGRMVVEIWIPVVPA